MAMESMKSSAVAGHRVVGEVTSHHACEPSPLIRDGQMPASPELVVDLLELGPHPFGDGVAPEPETPVLALPTDVGEAQEVEGFRPAKSPCRSSLGGEPPELDEPGLVRMQFQAKLREPLTKIVQEPPGVTGVLEPHDEVIGEPHHDHIAAGVPVPPLSDPSVEHVVEV